MKNPIGIGRNIREGFVMKLVVIYSGLGGSIMILPKEGIWRSFWRLSELKMFLYFSDRLRASEKGT